MRACTIALALVLGCTAESVDLPAPGFAEFRARVYPLLLRDCGMSRCHGDERRFFVVWGPGRTRLLDPDEDADPELEPSPFDPPTEEEIWMSYQRTRASLSHAGAVDESPLLRKPLDGNGHGGEDRWGVNLWTREDLRWQLVAAWAEGAELPALDDGSELSP